STPGPGWELLSCSRAPTPCSGWNAGLLVPRLRRCVHEIVDDLVEAVPRRFAIGLVAHQDRVAGVELLVQLMAAGEFGADQVPGELVELHAFHRRHRGRPPPVLEALLQLGIL